jgi:DNA-binding PadR family transcriptional regulator
MLERDDETKKWNELGGERERERYSITQKGDEQMTGLSLL